MKKVSVIIPNYNGMQYVKRCLDSLQNQTLQEFETIFVDNGSDDGSKELVRKEYPRVKLIELSENTGFCRAVNEGIKATRAEYVVLLNNDTEAEPEFLEQLYEGIRNKKKAFSGAAMMLQFHDRGMIDDAGNFYNAFGWAFARGKGKPEERYRTERKIFLPAAVRRFIGGSWLKNWDISMKNILLIWRIRILDIGRRLPVMRTGIFQKHVFIMWEAGLPDHVTISLRFAILPEIISICCIRTCRYCRSC